MELMRHVDVVGEQKLLELHGLWNPACLCSCQKHQIGTQKVKMLYFLCPGEFSFNYVQLSDQFGPGQNTQVNPIVSENIVPIKMTLHGNKLLFSDKPAIVILLIMCPLYHYGWVNIPKFGCFYPHILVLVTPKKLTQHFNLPLH